MTKKSKGVLHRRNDPHNLPLQQAREQYLRAYDNCQQVALAELARAPLEAFQQEGAGFNEDLWDKVRYSARFPRLTESLQAWARKFHFEWQGEPAQWVMAAALTTLGSWSASTRAPEKRHWAFPFHLSEEYGGIEADLQSIGRGENDVDVNAIHIDIPSWDLANGESKSSFQRRAKEICGEAIEEHIRKIESQQWTRRQKLTVPEYIEGLALWQCGFNLKQIREALEEKGFHVGSGSDRTSVHHGIDAAARFIGLDRRPSKR